MPTQSLEKSGYIYIVYRRNEFRDFLEFRGTIEAIFRKINEEKNIIIDFSIVGTLSEWEISVLANIVKRFQGTNRWLKIIADETQKNKIESTNLLKAGNVSIHVSQNSLFGNN